MRFKNLYYGGVVVLLFGALLISQAAGEPNNGSFEIYDYNEFLGFNTPTGWYHDANYAAVVSSFTRKDDRWKLSPNLYPFEGEKFLVLSSGKEVLRTEPNSARVWQTITVDEGDKLTGVFFFGTVDYSSFLDWGEIKLVPIENPALQEIIVVYVDVEDVGSYGSGDAGSMSGWKRFEYTFDADQAGIYEMIIRVSDYQDSIYDSYLAVDKITLCHNPPLKGDFSCDCIVNLEDFAFLAADWLCDCNDPYVLNDPQSDPNLYNDPNSNCLLGTDLSADGPVNINDLKILSENWLTGLKED